MIYFAYIHFIITNGIIFWGNSPYTIKLFRIQEKGSKNNDGSQEKDSCRDSFKEMTILSLCSEYINSLMQYVVNNRDLFTRSAEVYNKGTRPNINAFPQVSLTKVQKEVYYSGIKIYNHLPKTLKQVSRDQKSFVPASKRFMYVNSFYSVEEYFSYKC
jgi:hypothetical protein